MVFNCLKAKTCFKLYFFLGNLSHNNIELLQMNSTSKSPNCDIDVKASTSQTSIISSLKAITTQHQEIKM